MAFMRSTASKAAISVSYSTSCVKFLRTMVLLFSALGFSAQVLANDERPSRQMYFPFEPDITTNFIKIDEGRHLGYIRVGIEAVVDNSSDLSLVEHHAPLLRDAFITIFGRAQEGKVRSLTGRQELRQECLQKAQDLLERETGRQVIRDLIFTTYLYQ